MFNVYGPGEPDTGPSSTVVARFLKAKRDGQPLVVHGNGSQRRDFVHVEDVVSALILLADKGEAGDPYDVGTGYNHSIKEVAGMVGGEITHASLPPGQMEETKADVGRMAGLGWRAKWRLPEYVRSQC